MSKIYNVIKPEQYTGKDGQEKTTWHNIGTLIEFIKSDGSTGRLLKIPAIGLEARVFEQEVQRDQKDQKTSENSNKQASEGTEEEVKVESIPF